MSTRDVADREAGRRERRQRLPFLVRWLFRLPLVLSAALVVAVVYLSLDFADISTPAPDERRPAITLLDREGAPFARYGDHYGEMLAVEEMSPWLPAAVVAVEDRRFWQHPGLDPIGIARAAWRNITAGGVVQGGSTITQQLAKVAFLTPERSFKRKIQEALYAVWLELRFDKEEILQAYLNRIYLGAGTYGVDAAAKRYFGKSAREVTLPEAAMLAGLIKAPSRYAPTRDLGLARERAAAVLNDMAEVGFITPEQAAEAKANPAALAAQPRGASDARYFADWVFGQSSAFAGGEGRQRLLVRTTLDRELQAAAERALADVLSRSSATQGAVVAMTPRGEVLAMVGGVNYPESQFNRAVQARRQPGSAFKLFVFLAALEEGWRPRDTISAAPLEVDGWRPTNFDDEYPATVTLEEAFARSINTAAVRLSEEVGRADVIDMARRLGVTSELPAAPSLALGAGGVSLLEITAAYATLAAGGRLVWPEGIEAVQAVRGDAGDEVLYRRDPPGKRVLDRDVVRPMVDMMRATMEYGSGRRVALDSHPSAGKTGTSSEFRDAWFVGFTADLVVGVWVGNDDSSPTRGVTGSGPPATIWREVMRAGLRGVPPKPLLPPAPEEPAPVAAVRGWLDRLIDGVIELYEEGGWGQRTPRRDD